MEKIKEYAIIHACIGDFPSHFDRGANLQKQVNDAIKNGWQPIGGVMVDAKGNMYQSMILKLSGVNIINMVKRNEALIDSGL
jgi:hypothetical protein